MSKVCVYNKHTLRIEKLFYVYLTFDELHFPRWIWWHFCRWLIIIKSFMKRFELVLLGGFSLDVSRKKKRRTLLGTIPSHKTISIKNQFLSLSYKGAYHCTKELSICTEWIGRDNRKRSFFALWINQIESTLWLFSWLIPTRSECSTKDVGVLLADQCLVPRIESCLQPAEGVPAWNSISASRKGIERRICTPGNSLLLPLHFQEKGMNRNRKSGF